jgi:sec-independent protein translocase protein TatA
MGDLFDSWPKILIIALLVIVLFGARKLPGAAKSLGQSMRILKHEVTKLHDDDDDTEMTTSSAPFPSAQLTASAPAPAPASASADQQSQIDTLQQQIRDLQRSAAMDPVSASKQDDI